MTYLGLLNSEMIEARQAALVGRALKRGELDFVRDKPMRERFGDHDSIRGAGVIGIASKPIACRPCDFALRSPSTSTAAHGRRHPS